MLNCGEQLTVLSNYGVVETLPILAGANAIDLRAAQTTGHAAAVGAANTRAVLLLHGFGDTPQTLRALAEDLHAHGYDVRVPLLPGHGRTLAAFDTSTHREWIDAALAELMAMRARYPWVALGGLSMGGAIASILAAEVRDLPVLVLLAPYLGMPLHIKLAAIGHRLLVLYPGPIGGRSPQSIHDPAERAKNLSYGAVPPRALKQLASIVSLARKSLPQIVAPTLLVQSRFDNRIKPQTAQWAFERIGATKKRLLMTDMGGHIITVDYGKERVFEEVRAWLRGGPGTTPQPDTDTRLESRVETRLGSRTHNSGSSAHYRADSSVSSPSVSLTPPLTPRVSTGNINAMTDSPQESRS